MYTMNISYDVLLEQDQ